MTDRDPTPLFRRPGRIVSERALADLSGLIAGLDQLELFQSLPDYPETADPGIPFGRFRLRACLGAGAHGRVLLADDPRLGRRVVVKVPQPAVLADPDARERFLREARAVAVLDDPGIVQAFEAGEVGGLPYLAAGFIDGPNLATWLASRGPLSHKEAARLVSALARSLHHAHERGILHCDLKPGYILMQPVEGSELPRPVVTDFGMARILTDDPAATRTIQPAGTPLYMSPEQASGKRRDLTARADVYALGVILYELLTGKTPFTGESGAEVMERVQCDPTPCAGSVNPRVPRDLRAICRRCLEKDPRDRYPSAAALAEDLNRFLGGYPVEARRLGPATRIVKWARRNPLGVAAVVAIAGLLAGLGMILAEWWAAGIRHTADLRVADAQRVEAEERAAMGEFLATSERVRHRRENQEPDWPALNLADLRRLQLPRSLRDFSLLRTEVAAALGSVDLGAPRIVGIGFRAYNPAFSQDGSILALGSWFPDDTGICSVMLIDPSSGAQQRILRYPADTDWERGYSVAKKKPLGPYDGCRSLLFSPDGRWLVLGTRSGWLVRWDLTNADPAPVRWRHAPPPDDPSNERVSLLAFTPKGRLLLSSDDRRVAGWDTTENWTEVLRQSELIAPGVPRAEIIRPARSGDPLWVAVGATLSRVSDERPWLTALDATPFTGLRPVAGPAGHLLFAGRGSHDLYCPYIPRPAWGLEPGDYAKPFTTPGDQRTEDWGVGDVVVSPDGLHLATSSEHIKHLKLWDVASGQLLSARTLTGGSLRLAFSPDGHTLAVCEDNRTLLFSLPPPRVAATVALQEYPIVDADIVGESAVLLGQYPGSIPIVRLTNPCGPRGWDHSLSLEDMGRNSAVSNSWRTALAPGGRAYAFPRDAGIIWQSRGQGIRCQPVRGLNDVKFGSDCHLWIAAGSLLRWGADGSVFEVPLPEPQAGDSPHPVCLAVEPSAVLMGRSDGAVSRVDPESGVPNRTVWVFEDSVTAANMVKDAQLAVVGSSLGAVRVVRLETGEVVIDRPMAHRDAVTAIAVGPRGWFATGSRDRQVKIWNPAGREILTLPQSRPIRRLFWSADGRTLTVLAGEERALRRWDLAALKASLTELSIDPDLP